MMKAFYLLLPIVALSVNAADYQEEDYIDTPEAEQISDLRDDDKDGVVNARDLCPGTPTASQVDNDGCGETVRSQEVRQLRILFAHDSFEINPIFSDQITTMAEFLKKYKTASIEIQGYASKVGSNEYNLELSKKRANEVQSEILQNGIAADRVRIVGFGESRLEKEGDDPTSHALNRRVTATVVGLEEQIVEEWTIFTTLEK
ncbi:MULTISPECIES: OmpA family protein [Vibrio]|jgi:outer membrane protein OmpA-like peptidoglycan-associated protein|uniref:Membrane protein n=2 Tax=Vibrio fortis TaxID=212667 RepID=A0A066UZY1_9VIBR|nr:MULTISPECIES: OmpA family protein [Vibrio]KAB0289959.1 OmpA family protein [Vibrio fortis]KDN29779.1 membrane protein [Vibrio fortis]MDK9763482.1 OmpA family protein [Vibrio sp. D420a]